MDKGRSTEWERAEQGYTVLASDDSIPNHPRDLRGMLLKKKKSWKAEEVQRKWTTGGLRLNGFNSHPKDIDLLGELCGDRNV